ncbi:MAG TPA: hypothetical protein VJK72_00090, partial [Candidatus Nanoarchaeia archaeon]|nr:hypothetical protein [Candidatus Nanoarchaeia archaeon]
ITMKRNDIVISRNKFSNTHMEETTIFREALGNSPVIRVLECLIEGRGLDYSLTDIAENADVGWTTLHRIWDNLVSLQIVKHTRVIGKAKLFKLNLDNPAVKDLVKLFDTLMYQETEKLFQKEMEITH